MAGVYLDLPDDALVQVLLLLPTSSRRRFRLVCKHWREIIDERTPERRRVQTKILALRSQRGVSRALVFGDDGGSPRHAWTYPCSNARGFVDLVGTCNGLLCLHEYASLGFGAGCLSAGSVTNPITGETLALPPVPTPWELEHLRALGKYSFGYHLTTGAYKVVHIPCRQRQAVDTVQVFTLGGVSSWREVPVVAAGGASYHRSCDAISVDGSTYWLNAPADRVIALDLGDERVAWFDMPPVAARPVPEETRWKMTSVHARLGLTVMTQTGVDVWVLERHGGEPRWSFRYTLVEQLQWHWSWSVEWQMWLVGLGTMNWGMDHALPVDRGQLWVTAPQLERGGHVVCESSDRRRLYRHEVVDGVAGRRHEKSKQLWPLEMPLLTADNGGTYCLPTKIFAYVETLEPVPMIHGQRGGSEPASP